MIGRAGGPALAPLVGAMMTALPPPKGSPAKAFLFVMPRARRTASIKAVVSSA